MNITKFYCGTYVFKVIFAFLLLGLLSTQGFAANYPLEIIQPRPNLDTKNRFYKAYPDMEYNVRLAVIAGEFPYRFKLTSAPSGMTIDERGEITWANPTTSGTPYNVTATVTDAQSSTSSVSWTITVTTSGFRFIDAVNGKSVLQGGTGTISNPWKSMKDMYEGNDVESKNARSYAGEFLYWRGGTYTMDAYKEFATNGDRTPFINDNKPLVWLAYPGENPVFDMSAADLGIFFGGTHTYFDGLEFIMNTPRGRGITIDSDVSHVTFRRNKLHGITKGFSGGNSSTLMIARGSSAGSYYSFQDNEMYDVNVGYGILGYNARKVLVENNVFHNIGDHPIGPKEGTQMWFIRSNTLYNNPWHSINITYSGSNGILSGDIEISFNLVKAGGGQIDINSNQFANGLPVYIFRNTFMDEARQARTTSTNGIFYWDKNVIVNETSFPDKIERWKIEDPARVVVTDNLTGSKVDNIVDSQGLLTADYTAFIGSRGHEIDNRRPLPPVVTVK